MKKIVLLLMVVAGVLTAQAGDYTYLTFETTDGAKASVAVENLTLTVSEGTVTAGSQTFTLSNLSKMYFSISDETTGIETVRIETICLLLLSGNLMAQEQKHRSWTSQAAEPNVTTIALVGTACM